MGKYKEDWNNYDEGLVITNNRIANELAEMNKLTRYKLDKSGSVLKDTA